jgi:tripartite-type tricarboxylate transporter receptor subunit TctC
MVGPAGMPEPIVAKINATLREVIAGPEVRAVFQARDMTGVTSTPKELEEMIRKEIPRWAEVVTAAGATAD